MNELTINELSELYIDAAKMLRLLADEGAFYDILKDLIRHMFPKSITPELEVPLAKGLIS